MQKQRVRGEYLAGASGRGSSKGTCIRAVCNLYGTGGEKAKQQPLSQRRTPDIKNEQKTMETQLDSLNARSKMGAKGINAKLKNALLLCRTPAKLPRVTRML